MNVTPPLGEGGDRWALLSILLMFTGALVPFYVFTHKVSFPLIYYIGSIVFCVGTEYLSFRILCIAGKRHDAWYKANMKILLKYFKQIKR